MSDQSGTPDEPELVDPDETIPGGGIPGLSGLPDLGGLIEQAARMQEQLLEAQERTESTIVEGQSGGGAVKISVTGGWEFEDVRIDPSVIDPSDADLLADLVLAALRDVSTQITDLQRGSIGGLDLGDVNFGGLGGIGGIGDALGDT
jgi:nucleoid-associated protein EbfC